MLRSKFILGWKNQRIIASVQMEPSGNPNEAGSVSSNDMRCISTLTVLGLAVITGMASAHPMGNLSINHYARLEPGAKGVAVTYVLDLAELPTFELTQTWGTPQGTPKAVLDRKAAAQARQWVANLTFLAERQTADAARGIHRLGDHRWRG